MNAPWVHPDGDRRREGWSTIRIALALYPLGAGAAAINLYFASLIASWAGLPFMHPETAIGWGAVIGAPATLLFARHIRKLMDIAQENGD